MKRLYLIPVLIFLMSSLSFGQNALVESRRSSYEVFIYKLDKSDVRALHLKGRPLSESMLHTFAGSCTDHNDIPELPRGNYVLVRTVENKLQFSGHTVDDFCYNLVKDEKAMLYITDTLGNVITDAVVRRGAKKLVFDKATQTYNTPRIGDSKIVEVDNDGVFHYIEFENNRYRRSNFFGRMKYKVRKLGNNIRHPSARNKFEGFVVFSKPRYKPGETVRFKAHINQDGKPCNKEVEVSLVSYYPKRDTVLTKLQPYRPGMYEWEFTLSDSLKIQLDVNYFVTLSDGEKRVDNIRNSFRYEEYELDRVKFTAKTDKAAYVRGDSVKLTLSATDDTGMPVYDSRVYVSVSPGSNKITYHSDSVFIPNRLWHHEVDMAGLASKEVVLPDSIFMDDVSMNYRIMCSFLDSANEKQSDTQTIYMDSRDRLVDFSVDRGTVTVREFSEGRSMGTAGLLTAYNSEGNMIYRDSVMLPYSFPLMWNADSYEVATATSRGTLAVQDIESNILDCVFYRDNGGVRLVVDNPSGYPFWYTVKKGRSIVGRGYATELDYTRRDNGKNGYSAQISYIMGDRARTIRRDLPYAEKNISMEVNTPEVVYPGQTASVEVVVRDKKGRPVKDADITAYAFTSKFRSGTPYITVYGKTIPGRGFRNRDYEVDDDVIYNRQAPMDRDLWRVRMGLDSIEYYKFLYPETVYSTTVDVPGGITQISPYVVVYGNGVNGGLQGVHLLWIDEQPHYFRRADQADVYSFPVEPGFHTLKLRTYDREIIVDNVFVEKGKKTILSVNGKRSATYIPGRDSMNLPVRIDVSELRKNQRGQLTGRDMSLLEDYMIGVNNNFGNLNLPNQRSVPLPAAIEAGGVYYNLNAGTSGKGYGAYTGGTLLAGPFPYRPLAAGNGRLGTLYVDTLLQNGFIIEGGYDYDIRNGYVKQRSWKDSPLQKRLPPFTPNVSFTRNALTADDITEIFRSKLTDMLRQGAGLVIGLQNSPDDECRLTLAVNDAVSKEKGKPVLIYLTGESGADSVKCLYYGNTRSFTRLPEGRYGVNLIFSDTTRHTEYVGLRKDGVNYLRVRSATPVLPDSIGREALKLLSENITATLPVDPVLYYSLYSGRNGGMAVKAGSIGRLNAGNYDKGVVTGTVRDRWGEPLLGVAVMVEGKDAAVTDIDGRFVLPYTGAGNIVASYLGCKSVTTELVEGYDYNIFLEEDSPAMEDVVVVAYGLSNKAAFTGSTMSAGKRGSVATTTFDFVDFDGDGIGGTLSGSLAGIGTVKVRGTVPVSDMQPLIILNGVPYEGALSDLDPAGIVNFSVLKNGDTAVYGSRAAAGVILIETSGVTALYEDDGFDWAGASGLRTDFRDDAFWYPRLSTDGKGKLSFEVTYPDDITNWTANFIAVGGRRQADMTQLNIKSYKPLNAQLSLPGFAVLGDSLNVIGRLTGHTGDTLTVKRTIEVNDDILLEGNVEFSKSHTDIIPVKANVPDSVKVVYSMTTENGYLDGEQRFIPVYMPGLLESHGEFMVIADTATHRFVTDPSLGEVTVHAGTSGIGVFLEEMDKIDRYPYMCNEQMASKVKALVSKKRVYSQIGMEFKDDGKINGLIRKLNANRNRDNLWGWWSQGGTEIWISRHIVEAMIEAGSEGYRTDFDRRAVSDALMRELNRCMSDAGRAGTYDGVSCKGDILDLLLLLKRLDSKIDYPQYYAAAAAMPDVSLNDRLRTAEAALLLGIDTRVDTDAVMALSQRTMLGSLYWSDGKDAGITPRYFALPNVGDVENTLAAYRILKGAGGHEQDMEAVRNYFFEQRKAGSWRNIYEASRIMETVLPDMLSPGENAGETVLTVNGRQYDELPLTTTLPAGEDIAVSRKGVVPVFFTAYQQGWNTDPARTSRGFSVETSFGGNGGRSAVLSAGESAELKVTVSVDADAEYVMIEVPIPAGCSYESKGRGDFRKEAHREYFREKVVIFCNKLPEGVHEFVIKLLPRYTGTYRLNPARAELMYFPTFYGTEEIKTVDIE